MKIVLKTTAFAAGLAALCLGTAAAQAQTAYDKLVVMAKAEVEKAGGVVRISTDWSDVDAKPVIEQFTKDFPFVRKVDYQRETGTDPFGRYLIGIQQGTFPPYDIMHVASEYEPEYLKAGVFVKPPLPYSEVNDSLPSDWPRMTGGAIDPTGYFVATTGNTRGIAYNPTLVKGDDVPKTWEDCASPKWRSKLLVDGNNKLQAFQHDPKTRDRFLKLFADMAKNDVVVVRGQELLVNKIASGEYPIGCGVNYQTVYRAIETQGVKTLAFTFGDAVPLEIATRLFVQKWSHMPATTELFSVWAATAGQLSIGKYAWRGFPWNAWSHNYEAAKGKYIALCDADCALKTESYDDEYLRALKIPVAGRN